MPRGSRTKLPLLSESLIDGWSPNSMANISSGVLPPSGILGSLKDPCAHGFPSAFQPPPVSSVWSLCSFYLHGGTSTQLHIFTDSSGNELYNRPLFLSNLIKAGLGIQSLQGLGMANRQTNTQTTGSCLLLANW